MGLCCSWGLLLLSTPVFSSAVLEHLAFFGGEEDKGVSNGFPLLQGFKENQQMFLQVHLGKKVQSMLFGFIKLSSLFPQL